MAKGIYTPCDMWKLLEDHAASKAIDRLPPQVAEKYAFWCAVVRQSGPSGLRSIKSFHDEKLKGKLAHLRSSRLSLQWRVVYRVEATIVTVYVERVSAHDYRP
jgi:plasmid maintenance system killer protein